MIKQLLGSSPLSSILGYVLAAFIVYDEMTTAGIVDKKKIAIAIIIAVLGRIVKDTNGIPAKKETQLMKKVFPDKETNTNK